MPIVEVGGRLQKRAWVSLPYSDHVPVLSSSSAATAEFLAALDRAWRDAGAAYLHVRGSLPGTSSQYEADVIHTLDLQTDLDAVRRRFHKMAVRGIRKGEREGVTVRRGERAEDLTEVFYGLHLMTRRRQGSPVQPKRFFRLLWERWIAEQRGHVLTAYCGKEPIAATVFLSYNKTLVYKFSASNPAALSLRPNHVIIWRAIQDACNAGMRVLDFGLSDRANTGLRAFKSRWGATEKPLVYTTLSDGAVAHRAGHAPRLAQMVIQRSPPMVCRAAGELFYRLAA